MEKSNLDKLGEIILRFENTKNLPISLVTIAKEKIKMHKLEHEIMGK